MKMPLFTKDLVPTSERDLSPQELFDAASANKNYSRKACIKSCQPKTVTLTGPQSGEERSVDISSDQTGQSVGARWRSTIFGRLNQSTKAQASAQSSPTVPGRPSPASVTASIPWSVPGKWQGRKAHFIVLRFQCHQATSHWLRRVQLDIRVWRAGDALESIAPHSHIRLLALRPPLAEDLGQKAPSIAFYGPRAVVGRPSDSQPTPYWNGHFKPDDDFRYGAGIHSPLEQTLEPIRDQDPRPLLHVVAYGDPQKLVALTEFLVGFVVLSDGKPFDLTTYSISYHDDLRPVRQYIWSPYKPAKFLKSASQRPKGQKRIRLDFASPDMKVRWKDITDWCKPYDTIWFGDAFGCIEKTPGTARTCGDVRCQLCNP